jgi:hypothetical protein
MVDPAIDSNRVDPGAPARAARKNGFAILACLNELAPLARLRAGRRPGAGATTNEQKPFHDRDGAHF